MSVQGKRISSRMTFFHKRVFPIIWFGIIAVFIFTGILASKRGALPLPFFIAPVVMMTVGYLIMKLLIFDLADEVIDCGDHLLVRNGGNETRVALTEIANVSYTSLTNPKRVTLSIRTTSDGEFKKISFSPPGIFAMPFASNPLVEDLIRRIDAARVGQRH